MDKHEALYVVRYFGRLMSEQERRAHRHLAATSKLTHGRSDVSAQNEAKSSPMPLREWLSEDPEVLRLASHELDALLLQTAERIVRDHPDKIVFNKCPRCGAVAKTPKAKQCRFCRHDWHPAMGSD